MAAGLIGGLVQGIIIVRLRLGSIGVTLGGLLVFAGVAMWCSENRTLPYDNLQVALAMGNRIAGIFSIRSVVAWRSSSLPRW